MLFVKVQAVNTAPVPRYAWFKTAQLPVSRMDGSTGFGLLEDGLVFCISRLNGSPMPKTEVVVLIILLSFAEFERAIIAERVHDKMAGAKRKGKFTGGTPVLGYDVDPDNHKQV